MRWLFHTILAEAVVGLVGIPSEIGDDAVPVEPQAGLHQ